MKNPTSLTTKLIIYAFYALFFLIPLAVTPWNFELFEFNKMMLVYLLTTIIAGSWIIQIILQKRVLLRRTPFDIPILLFLVSQLLSTTVSINLRTSILGYYSRSHGGLASTFSYIILFYAFVTFMGLKSNKKSTIHDLRSTPLGTSFSLLLTSVTLVSAYGIAEHFGIDKSLWVQDVQTRVFSTLGQPNWLAALLITVIPLTFAFSLSRTKPTIYYLLSTIYFATLLFTKSRSGILGFAIMFALFWLFVFAKTRVQKFPLKKFLFSLLILIVLSGIGDIRWIPQVNNFYKNYIAKNTRDLQYSVPQAPQIGTQLATGGTESGEIRKIVWKGALNVWRAKPILGSGVETFAYSYYNFRPAEHNLVSEWDFLYNKAHNEYLNFLATTGALGLATYLLLQTWVFIWLLKKIFEKDSQHTKYWILYTALLVALAGLSVSNFFGFSTVAVALLFFLYPAIAVVLTQKTATSDIRHTKYRSLSVGQKLSITLVLLATSYLLLAIGKWWYADTLFSSGKKFSEAGYAARAFPKLQQAVKLLPGEPTFRAELAEAASDLAVAFANQNATDSAIQTAQIALEQTLTTAKLNPVHLNFIKSRARVMFTLSQINPEFLSDARDALLAGTKLSPTDAKLTYNLGLLYLQLQDQPQALAALNKSVQLKPNYEAARFALGVLYEQLGEPDKAREQYKYILEKIAPDNSKVLEKLQNLE